MKGTRRARPVRRDLGALVSESTGGDHGTLPRHYPRTPRLPSPSSALVPWFSGGRRVLLYVVAVTEPDPAAAAEMVVDVLLEVGCAAAVVPAIDDLDRLRVIAGGSVMRSEMSAQAWRRLCARALRMPPERVPLAPLLIIGDGCPRSGRGVSVRDLLRWIAAAPTFRSAA